AGSHSSTFSLKILIARRGALSFPEAHSRRHDRGGGSWCSVTEEKIMSRAIRRLRERGMVAIVVSAVAASGAATLQAANRLDTRTVIANPQADIGDVYGWMAPDGRHLNLVMTIVGHSFSDRLRYELHVDSGKEFGKTTHTTLIVCRFPAPNDVDCRV